MSNAKMYSHIVLISENNEGTYENTKYCYTKHEVAYMACSTRLFMIEHINNCIGTEKGN